MLVPPAIKKFIPLSFFLTILKKQIVDFNIPVNAAINAPNFKLSLFNSTDINNEGLNGGY